LPLLLGWWLLAGCGGAAPDASPAGAEDADDVAFATELMYRDAALLNLLDVSLGRRLSPAVAGAGEQQRIDASERMTTASELLEAWGEKAPVTSRDHGAEHSSDNDVPELDGMPTGHDLQRLGELDGAEFESAYVELLTTTLEASRAFADAHDGSAESDELAASAVASAAAALEAL
jgi:hypothetical protein